MMRKIVIFGATGHAGSYLSLYAKNFFEQLGTNQYEIIATGRRQTNAFDKYGIKYYSADITKQETLSALPTEDIYAVMLLAAEIPAYMSGYDPQKYLDSIIFGTFNVLEYCRKVNADRILFTTSCYDVFEYPAGTVIHPDTPRNFKYTGDHAIYVISKNTAIELIEHYHQQYGMKEFIFRMPTIYSYSTNHYYYPSGIKTMRPLYKMIHQAMASEPLELWGDPNYAKDMLHVYDMGQMFCKAVLTNREKGLYNCGTGIPVTLQQELDVIIQVFSPADNPSKIIYRPDQPSGGAILMDVRNAEEELGYEPQYDIVKLFEDFKNEMQLKRFIELRGE
jgi:UDP-glucose 4-epimerase